jgi:head-tail adaptor
MRNIGRLDKRIEIQTRSSTTRDAFGAVNFEQDWGDISVCFADVKETRGDERDVNGKQGGKDARRVYNAGSKYYGSLAAHHL